MYIYEKKMRILFGITFILINSFFAHAMFDGHKTGASSLALFKLGDEKINQETFPTWEELCELAKIRQENFQKLFSLFAQEKMSGSILELFEPQIGLINIIKQNDINRKKIVKSFHDEKVYREAQKMFINEQKVLNSINNNILILSYFKTHLSVERDLANYFFESLNAFINDQNKLHENATHELYEQTIFVVRKNLQTLRDTISDYLYSTPIEQIERPKVHNDQIVIDSEHSLLMQFVAEFDNIDIMSQNTIEIQNMAYFLLNHANFIKSPIIIFHLNSILFHLKIERILLDYCSDLIFDANNFHFYQQKDAQGNRFIWSRLFLDHSSEQLDAAVLGTEDKVKRYSQEKYQNSIISSICNFNPAQLTKSFIDRLYKPVVKESKVKKKKNVNTNTNKKTKRDKYIIRPQNFIPLDEEVKKGTAPEKQIVAKPARPKPVYFKQLWGNEYIGPVIISFLDLKDFSKLARTQKSFEQCLRKFHRLHQEKVSKIFQLAHENMENNPCECQISYEDYVYKRHVTIKDRADYVLDGCLYDFEQQNSFLALQSKIKEKTHNRNAPNLATYILRFHYTLDDESEKQIYQVDPNKKFMSGSRGFFQDEMRYKKKYNIVNAFDDLLTEDEQSLVRKSPYDRGDFAQDIIKEKVNTFICQASLNKSNRDTWKYNSLDSEALLLLDCANSLPHYLESFCSITDKKITLHGVALCVTSYYDCCWKCRNLIQGFQWGLKELLEHLIEAKKLNKNIKISDDFSTIAITVGQTRCKNMGTIPRCNFDDDNKYAPVILGTERQHHHGARHKLTVVQK